MSHRRSTTGQSSLLFSSSSCSMSNLQYVSSFSICPLRASTCSWNSFRICLISASIDESQRCSLAVVCRWELLSVACITFWECRTHPPRSEVDAMLSGSLLMRGVTSPSPFSDYSSMLYIRIDDLTHIRVTLFVNNFGYFRVGGCCPTTSFIKHCRNWWPQTGFRHTVARGQEGHECCHLFCSIP